MLRFCGRCNYTLFRLFPLWSPHFPRAARANWYERYDYTLLVDPLVMAPAGVLGVGVMTIPYTWYIYVGIKKTPHLRGVLWGVLALCIHVALLYKWRICYDRYSYKCYCAYYCYYAPDSVFAVHTVYSFC